MTARWAARGNCDASVVIQDDRWGGFTDDCELSAGHPGPHVARRAACVPEAWLSWGNAEGARREVPVAGEDEEGA